jgi:hypothetical protein
MENYLQHMSAIDPGNFVGAQTGVRFYFQHGARDGNGEDARILHSLPKGGRSIQWYDAGHDPGPEAVKDRQEWLIKTFLVQDR